MSATASPAPLLALPGFLPDAVKFATRFTAALLLAYLVAFFIQLDTASSAGVCVAIVMQPSPGMAMSKMLYRVAGTVVGGAVGLAIVSAFAQDRTMLLAAFTVWLGVCSFAAALLRDFRAYGAVLCGYTVGIIAVLGIDAPDGALFATLNRVAAILIGVAAVGVVNGLLTPSTAFDGLVAALRARLAAAADLAGNALAGRGMPSDAACARIGADTLALATEANYAATELPDGPARSAGARSALAALLGLLSASRAIAAGQRTAPGRSRDMFLAERTAELQAQRAAADQGLRDLTLGGRPHRSVRLRVHYDMHGAARTAARTMAAVVLGSLFCIYAGWPGATLLLVQLSATTALLGMAVNPTEAGLNIGLALPLPALLAGLVSFGLLPLVSGFVPFAISVGGAAFLIGLLARHPRLVRFSPGLLLYFTLLLSPSNMQIFDVTAFLNSVMVQVVAAVFMVLTFVLILPVSRKQRFFRVADAVQRDLRQTLEHGRRLDQAVDQSQQYDRLAQALVWLGRPTPARLAVLQRLYAFSELDITLRRAWSGLDEAEPALPGPVATARAALLRPHPAGLLAAAEVLAAARDASSAQTAVSGLYGAHLLLHSQWPALAQYGLIGDNYVA